MVERRIFLDHVCIGHTLGLEERFQHLVGSAREDVVRTEKVELLGIQLIHHVFRRGHQLLVRRGGRVEYVERLLLAFVLHGIEKQPVVFLEHGQTRLTADRCPATEGDAHLVLGKQLLRFFREERPIGGGIDNDRRDLLSQHASGGIDFVDRHQDHVPKGGLRNGHGAAQRMEHADFYFFLSLQGACADCRGGEESQEAFAKLVFFHYWILVWIVWWIENAHERARVI